MKWLLSLLLMTPIMILYMLWDHEEYLENKLHTDLKYALDSGTHDAALQVDPLSLDIGIIHFRPAEAYSALKTSLQQNLNLNNNLEPVGANILKKSVEIVYFDLVEDGPFPRVYNSGPPYNYSDVINGPSVIAIIKVPHPKYFGVSRDFEYVIGSDHEYKP